MFGISGDLSRRYLLPAIGEMAKVGALSDDFRVVGITRKEDLNIEDLLSKTSNKKDLKEHIDIFQMDATHLEEYKKLDVFLTNIENGFNDKAKCLFYLSLPPKATREVVEFLGESGLNKKNQSRLVLEKPFGFDLTSATDLMSSIKKYFHQECVYIVDHYLAKKIAQEIIPFREEREDFKKVWNRDFIEKIEIIVSEKIDIEGRVNFYEKTGAVRDYLQNHLLELLSLVIMDLSNERENKDMPLLREKILKSVKIKNAIFGQYQEYTDEVNNSESKVETFVSARLESSDSTWSDVPIILSTGKAMRERFAEIRIYFKENTEVGKGKLVFNIQPEGKIKWNGRDISIHLDSEKERLKDAYEYVLFGVMSGDKNLFVGEEEILQSWHIIEDARDLFEKARSNLLIYKKGSNIEELIK